MQVYRSTIVAAGCISIAVGQTAVTIETASLLQQIDGFGVSQAFGKASDFQALATEPRQVALDYLFNKSTGAGLSIIRNRIGSGGTGDGIEPTSPGSPSAAPTYVWDGDDRGQVWFSQSAMAYGITAIYADAWSAPGFMKTNEDEANGGYLCGVAGETCSSGDWRQAYADMLAQYIKYYRVEGINITQVGFLNEPDFNYTYSSMLSNSTHAASFIPILYTTLEAAGLSDVGITCCDATGWDSQKNLTADLVSAGMEKYLSHITSHGYTSEPDSVINTTLKVWLSENADVNSASCPGWYSSGATCEGLTWAQNIYTGMTSANLSAYLYWEGLEVNQTDSSAHLIDTDGTSVTPSGRLWALAMWSRFIRPGAYRVSTTGTVSGVGLAAFKNTNGNVVVVFTNTGSSAKTVEISFNDFTPSSTIAYLTDNDHQVAETTSSLSGGVITVSVPAYSMVTVQVLCENNSALSSTVTGSTSSGRSSILQHTTTSSWTSSLKAVPTLTAALNSTMASASSIPSREQASVQYACDGSDLDD